jgi:hypothetical protein
MESRTVHTSRTAAVARLPDMLLAKACTVSQPCKKYGYNSNFFSFKEHQNTKTNNFLPCPSNDFLSFKFFSCNVQIIIILVSHVASWKIVFL